jgi:hypothetical protein
MLWNMDQMWLLMAVTVVAILGFIVALALDAIMGREGFGPLGNMAVITAGFFLGIFVANYFGVRLNDMTRAAVTGVGGAFVSLFVLAAIKGAMDRL